MIECMCWCDVPHELTLRITWGCKGQTLSRQHLHIHVCMHVNMSFRKTLNQQSTGKCNKTLIINLIATTCTEIQKSSPPASVHKDRGLMKVMYKHLRHSITISCLSVGEPRLSSIDIAFALLERERKKRLPR